MVALGAWISPKNDRLTMHSWDQDVIEELVALLSESYQDCEGIVIDVEKRVADRKRSSTLEIHESRSTKNAERLVYAPGRPPIASAGHFRTIDRTARKVMGSP